MKALNNHMINTGRIASRFGSYLNLTYKEIDDLGVSGSLHDIGKVYISDKILKKQTALTKKEIEEIRKHPLYSKRILSKNNYNCNVIEGVLQHHERVDGKGYPLGITGEKISLIGKILAICDSYDAMTSKRVYQKQKDRKEALIEIEANLNTQFDEELGIYFINFIKQSL